MAGIRVDYIFVTAFLIPHIWAFENVPEMCKWPKAACQQLSEPEHPMFKYNCDRKNPMQDNQPYSCWEECQYNGILCKFDYCTGYRSRCSPTSTPHPTNLTTRLHGSIAVQNTTTSDVSVDGLMTKNAGSQNSTTVTTASTTVTTAQKTVEPEVSRNPETVSKDHVYYVPKSVTYTQVLITLIALGLLMICFKPCYYRCQRSRSRDGDAKQTRGGVMRLFRRICGKGVGGEKVKFRKINLFSGKDHGDEVFIELPDDENAQQHAQGKSAEKEALLSGSSEREKSTNDSELDRSTIEQLIKHMGTLNRHLQNLAMGNTENKSRQRHQSTSLPTVGDSTDNDQKTFHKVGQTSVRRADLDSLDKGRLTDDMVKALAKLYAQEVIPLSIRVQVISFHEGLREDFADQDVILWLRSNSALSEENTHFYLVIVEVEAKVIHVCDSLSNLEMDAEKRLVKREPRLAGFEVTNSILQTDVQRDSVSCGLYTIMFVEKYLAAIRDGTYSLGQVDSYHLKFLTAKNTPDPADYRDQLRNMSKQYIRMMK